VPPIGVDGGTNPTADAGSVADAGTQTHLDAGTQPGVDAGTGLFYDAGTPIIGAIDAGTNAWSWVDFPDSTCGNGVPTGIAVNPKSGSTDLFIYLQGGGACWEGLTCYVAKTADNFDTGYTAASFALDGTVNLPAFNRGNAANPFKDASFVFVPYCTGDVHAGTAVQSLGGQLAYFEGGRNMEAYLKRLKLTFPNVTKVLLTGSSAGAYGAELNYQRVVDAFPSAQVHVLADSGQMINPTGTLLKTWIAAWNVVVPASCIDCLTDFPKYIGWLASNNPTRRFALLAYSKDQVLRNFFGYPNDAAGFQTQTEALLTSEYDPHANAKYFYLDGTSHTMLGSQFTIQSPSNVALNDFITHWYTGSSSWASVKP
jgi:hypothetical protein